MELARSPILAAQSSDIVRSVQWTSFEIPRKRQGPPVRRRGPPSLGPSSSLRSRYSEYSSTRQLCSSISSCQR